MALLDVRLVRHIALSGVTITAQIQPDGTLCPVGSAFEKLLAAARERALPRIHTVIVAADQDLEQFGLERDRHHPSLYNDPNADFQVIYARDLAEAVMLLHMSAETRWGDVIDCTLEMTRHHDFVGRHWLAEHVQTFLHAPPSGYLLLTGGPGVGKSAFVTAQILQRPRPAVYHFIKRGMGNWDEPDAMLRSLTAQLRCKYALLQTPAEAGMTARAEFFSVLQRMRLEPGQQEVIYLDGLDEAFGLTSRFAHVPLHDVLPRALPAGIVMVLTSRPGEHLQWLANPIVCRSIELDSQVRGHGEDIWTYLQQQNQLRHLDLDENFIERLVSASEGSFAAAVLYMREPSALPAWRQDPVRIPQGLTGWLMEQWQHVVFTARREGLKEELVRGVLGLLALAREPLSREHLQAFLTYALRQENSQQSVPHIGLLPVQDLVNHLPAVLRLAQEFFDPLDPVQGAAAPYRFYLTHFLEFVMGQLTSAEQQDYHRVLAVGCTGWAGMPEKVRDYALRYCGNHLYAARQLNELLRLLCDEAFVKARCEAAMAFEMVADIAAAAQAQLPLEPIAATFIQALETKQFEPFRQQLRSALRQCFGLYFAWPLPLQVLLNLSDAFNVMLFLADLHDMEGRYEQAEQVLRRMQAVVAPHETENFSTVYVRLAMVLDHQDRLEEAMEILDRCVTSLPRETRPDRNYWWPQYHQGICQRRLCQYDKAKTTFGSIRRETIGSGLGTAALHQLGIIDLELGAFAEAEKKFDQCKDERGEDKWNHRRAYEYRRLGQVYALTGRLAEARSAFEASMTISAHCANERYKQQTQEDIIAFLEVPVYLREHQPERLVLAELASRFGIQPTCLAAAFRVLSQEHAGYLEVVDARSVRPTGQVVRWDVVHNAGVWHTSVSVLIVDAHEHVVLQQRGESESWGRWDVSVTGHVDVGENDALAALRETREELGLVIGAHRLWRVKGAFRKQGDPSAERDRHESRVSYIYRTNKKNRERVRVFIVTLSEAEKRQIVTGHKGGALAVQWVALSEAAEHVRRNPETCASALKQLFADDAIFSHIRQEMSKAVRSIYKKERQEHKEP